MTYAFVDNYSGYPPLESVVGVPAALNQLPISPGFIAEIQDPVWGPGEAVFARAGGGIRIGGLCVLTPVYDTTNNVMQQNMTEAANSTFQSRACYVYMGNVALTTGQYGWFMMTGVCPINGTASVAAGSPLGITAAGQVGAYSTGKGLYGAVSVIAATNTLAKAGTGASGDNQIFFPNTQGFFVGGYLSGTGVGTNAIVQQVLPDRLIVTVVNSAAIAGTVTQTANNATIFWNFAALNRAGLTAAIA